MPSRRARRARASAAAARRCWLSPPAAKRRWARPWPPPSAPRASRRAGWPWTSTRRAPRSSAGPRRGGMREQRDLRWNFGAALIDVAGWGLGMTMVSHVTILPFFVQALTDRPAAVGLIQAVMYFGWLVPGILVAGRVER